MQPTSQPTYPAIRYHPSGDSRRVETAEQDVTLKAQGWGPSPFPPPPEPEQREDLQAQIDKLTLRVAALEKKKAS